MRVIATVVLFFTVAAGAVVLGCWLHPERSASDRRSVVLASTHILVALAAVSAWLIYLISSSSNAGRFAVGGLVATATLGASTFLSSRTRERSGRFPDPPEPVPLTVLVVHGGAAAMAVLLAVVTVAQK